MLLFITGLIISGVTAFPLLYELDLLAKFIGADSSEGPGGYEGIAFWVLTVRRGLSDTYLQYPWMAYGTDWLAFGHIAIAFFFIRPLIDPRSSRATIYAGIAACIGVIPLAFICGPIRDIPFFWRIIDCSFGLIGLIPLIYCLRLLKEIER